MSCRAAYHAPWRATLLSLRRRSCGTVSESGGQAFKLHPPQGRELLAAVKLGLPGAKEEFERQQRQWNDRFEARKRGRGTYRYDSTTLRETFSSKDALGYYKALGLEGSEGSASLEEVKAAFREKAKVHHPDAETGSSDSFRFLVRAYTILKDPASRTSYDASCMY
mmetsp:Transcript_11829/g.35969  ORF Transcript_11829/g.35969 Transcript_11829/m.35969 type:complete len:166 (+) Transcript_11829:121-618(+)